MIVEAQDLSFAYGARSVFQMINLRAGPGITVLAGPNAAGKSTLLKCLCRMLRPSGRLTLDGREIGTFDIPELARTISYLPQDLGAKPALTVLETVLLGRVHDLSWKVSSLDLAAAEDLLEQLNLTDLADRKVRELSGGQFQMATIAQSLLRNPKVLLMDEPTSSLDLEHQFSMLAWIRRFTDERQMTTILALHDLNIAARFADSVCLLAGGGLRHTGTPRSVLTEENIREIYRVQARVEIDSQGRALITPLGTL